MFHNRKKALFNRNYILVLQGTVVSGIGDVFYSIAIGIWVYHETGSTILMGSLSSISYFASLFLQPIGGVFADHLNKKKLIIAADIVRGIFFLILSFFAIQHTMRIWQIIVVACIAAIANSFFCPAADTMIAALVSKKNLVQANAFMSGTNSIVKVAGNAIGGILVVSIGAPWIIFFDGISFLLSGVSEMFIRLPQRDQVNSQNQIIGFHVAQEFWSGLKYIAHTHDILMILCSIALINLLNGGFSGIVYVWCFQKGMSTTQYGLFMGVESCAAVIATLILGIKQISPSKRYVVFFFSGIFQCIFGIITMSVNGFFLCSMFNAGYAFFTAITNMLLFPAVLHMTDDSHRGRVLGIFNACCEGGTALSMLLYGFACEYFGTVFVALIGSILVLFPSFLYFTNKSLKKALICK